MNLLLETFFEQYGLIIILILALGLFMGYYYFRSKKYQQTEATFHSSLKIGDKVKTYSGFYGTISKITETTDGKIVTLQLGGDAFVEVDVRAIAGLDAKEEIVEEEKPLEIQEEKTEDSKAENIEEKPEFDALAKFDALEDAEDKKEEIETPKEEPKKRSKKKK